MMKTCLFIFQSSQVFSTDAGQLSDRLKSFAGQNKTLQDLIFVVRILFSMLRFTGYLSDRLKIFAEHNENLPVLSGSLHFS